MTMTTRVLMSLCVGAIVAGGPLLVIRLGGANGGTWADWLAFVWVPGALIAKSILRLQPHDGPYVVWSILLSGVLYTVVSAEVLRRYWR